MGSHSHPSSTPQGDETVQVEPIDPLHDIDGRKTLLWVAIFVVVVFGGMWLLAESYGYVLDQEQHEKVWNRETTELNALHAMEAQELSKTEDLGGGKQRISIDDALRRLAEK